MFLLSSAGCTCTCAGLVLGFGQGGAEGQRRGGARAHPRPQKPAPATLHDAESLGMSRRNNTRGIVVCVVPGATVRATQRADGTEY